MADPNLIPAAPAGDIYQFPTDLGEYGNIHVAQFNIVEYVKPAVSRFDIKNLIRTIRLPLPQKLSNPDMLEYDEFSATLMANLIATGQETGTGLTDKFATGTALVGASILQGKLGDEAKLVQAMQGVSINPRTAHVFKTPKARELQFEYSLVARNPAESDAINRIINLFRYHAYPRTANNETLFGAPELFVIRYLTVINGGYRENPYLAKPLPAALVGINVDENTYGDVAMFKDTFAPVERKLTLMFKEMEIDTKETLADRYPGLVL